MSQSSAPGGHRSSGRTAGQGPRLLVAVLLGLAVVVPLLVFVYDTEEPTLWGFPFYYWFQFLLIPLVSLATFVAYRVTEGLRRRERTEHGLPADPEGAAGERRDGGAR